MVRFRILLFASLAAGVVSVASQDGSARPRLRHRLRIWWCCGQPQASDTTQQQPRELTKADIPQGVSPALRALIEATFTNEYEVQHRAIQELGGMGGRAAPAVPFLVRIWAKDSGLLQFWALQALDNIGDAAAESMVAAIKDSSGDRRKRLVGQLGQCRNWAVREGVLTYLNDADVNVRRAAISGLFICNDPRLVAPLVNALKDQDAEVRKAAIRYFNEWPAPAAFEPILALVKDKEPSVREEALRVLGEFKDPRLIPVLLDVLQDTREEAGVRWQAAFRLWISGDKRAFLPFLAALTDRQAPEIVRCQAAESLGYFHDERAVEPLIAALRDDGESVRVRASAAHALTNLADKRALALLTQVAKAKGDKALRFWGAMGAVTLTGGAIDDEQIVNAIRDYRKSFEGIEEYGEQKQEALRKVAEHGQTEAVRSAAKGSAAKTTQWGRQNGSGVFSRIGPTSR